MAGKKAPKKARVRRATAPAPSAEQNTGAERFPIVGLGASAGGLEAFENFFRNVPRDSGMAFVLVTHLDPDHESTLTAILQRTTALPVREARDQVTVRPNSVYIIPPNREMAIFHGALQLSLPEQPRGHRLPIDSFLRSLADDQGERAIGIILSGTGTDGTLGLRAILGAGGVSLVQEPATAKYDGMPASAIQAGYAMYVLPVEKMPQALLAGKRTLAVGREAPPPAADALNRILMLLRSGTGHDFSQYKKTTIGRRIERRMSQHEIEDLELYARYLKEHPDEVQLLVKELLINVTSFFRNPEAFETLKKDTLPQLFADKPEGSAFRVWVAGCATGEEAYSIAILLREFMDETGKELKVQLYSTDLDDDAIAVARAGIYPPNIVQDVAPERLRRFFVKDGAGYRVKKEIRGMVVFAIQNVIKDPPFTKLDLVCCRNLMIYLEPELQGRLITTFQFALRPGGALFLSPSESTGTRTDLFEPLNRDWRIYRATHSVASARAVLASGLSRVVDGGGTRPAKAVKGAKEIHFAELTTRVLLQSYAPASVVTDLNGNILYVHGETGRYLRPAPGQATLNVVEMARGDLQLELRAALRSVATEGVLTLSREVSVDRDDGDTQLVSFHVRPLLDRDAGEGLVLISFQDGARLAPGKPVRGKRAAGSAAARRIEELERGLAYTKENLQATIEEQQASNEELESTNEELQSTNEELETSKEELQSLNEELVTVNAELQSKIGQMTSMQDDLKNLLDSNNIGTIFLDERLVVRGFTRDALRAYHLVATDVGRALRDIKSELEGEDLLVAAQAVLESRVPCEREVRTTDGACYLARVQPYRTLDDVVRGVVLTFVPLTELKLAEEALGEARKLAEDIIDTVREPLIVLDAAFRVVSASRSFYQRFRVAPDETVGRLLYELGDRQWDIPALRELLETILPRHLSFDDYVVEQDFPIIGRRRMLLSARRIVRKTENAELILLAIEMPASAEREDA